MEDRTDSDRTPNPIDVHVGARVRMRRKQRGISQEALAGRLKLTFQQVQKYERGSNRISASKLYEIARTLEVPISDFFEGLGEDHAEDGMGEPRSAYIQDMLGSDEGSALASAFAKLRNRRVRKRLVDLVRAMAVEDEVAEPGAA